MTKNQIITSVTRTFGKARFQIKKHSPEILVVAGVVGTVASAVMACRATTKVSTILDKAKEDIDTIHDIAGSSEFAEEYTVEDSKKDLTIVYAQTGLKLVKLYAPSVILGALSITSILASNNILRKRNVALAAAYTAVDKGFKEYRGRVVERFGEAVDRELKYNIKAKKVEETVVDEKTGKEKKVKKTVQVADGLCGHSPYAQFFDESSRYWEKDGAYNLMFLRAQQQWANDKLRSDGYLYLNDVYKQLDMPVTKAGQVVGWVFNEEDPNGNNYVDFGLTEVVAELPHITSAYERTYIIDPNVDGEIWSLMETKRYGKCFDK